jgi:uncharacterized protein (DUF983 family)
VTASFTAEPPSVARFVRLAGRALLLRCPNCGKTSLLKQWFGLKEACPACDVWLEREEGYFLGAMAVNFIVAEFVPMFVFAAIVISSWPHPPWQTLQIVVPLSMGLLPIVFIPWARMLWLALDWTFRPPSRERKLDHPRPGMMPR